MARYEIYSPRPNTSQVLQYAHKEVRGTEDHPAIGFVSAREAAVGFLCMDMRELIVVGQLPHEAIRVCYACRLAIILSERIAAQIAS